MRRRRALRPAWQRSPGAAAGAAHPRRRCRSAAPPL